MNKIVFLGPPGAGKGTVAKTLSAHLGIPHISTGDIIREAIASENKLGLEVKAIVESGKLLSDDLTLELVKKRFAQDDLNKGYILDGFPRTLAQARAFYEIESLDFVIFFDVDEKVLVERLSGRRLHKASGRIYHTVYNPPKVEGKDDLTGEDLIIRKDDEKESVLKRMEVYRELTYPVLSFYKEKNKDLVKTVDASLSVEEVYLKVKSFF